MKFLILLLSIGLAYSSILDEFDQHVEELVHDVKDATYGLKSLKEHLESEGSDVVDRVEDDIKEYASDVLRKYFQGARQDIETALKEAELLASKAASHVHDVESDVSRQVTKIKPRLTKVAKEVSSLVDKVAGPDGQKLIAQIESKARKIVDPSRITAILVRELTKTKAIQDLRRYVEDMPKEVEEALGIPAKKLNELLSDKEIAEIITYILDPKMANSIFDIFGKIARWFKDLGIKIKSKFSAFRDWAQGHWSKAIETIKSKSGPITALAKEFIGHAKDITKTVAKQALEFFKAHKSDIAKLVFTKAIEAAKTALASG